MNYPASRSATLTPQPAQSAQTERPIAPWVLTAALILIGVAVLLADATLTSEHRIAAVMQSGVYP
jgi:hypothetical protein